MPDAATYRYKPTTAWFRHFTCKACRGTIVRGEEHYVAQNGDRVHNFACTSWSTMAKNVA